MFSGSHHSAGFLEIINCFIHVLATVPSIYSEIKVFLFLFLFSVSARIWNALMVQIDGNVSLVKFKQSPKLYLLNNTLVISYSK